MADLVTTALAAAHQLTVVQYEADFERAATVLTRSYTDGCYHEGASSEITGDVSWITFPSRCP